MASREQLLQQIHESVAAYCKAEHDFSFDAKSPIVRLHEPTFSAEEINAAIDCMVSTHVTMGAKVKKFEREFADKYHFAHGMMDEFWLVGQFVGRCRYCQSRNQGRLEAG